MAEKPKAHVVHQTPSRVRLRIPERRHDEAFFTHLSRQLEDALEAEIQTNPATGSVLVISGDALPAIQRLGDRTPFAIVEEQLETQLSLPALRAQVEVANARFSRLLGGDARGYVIIVLIAMSFLQIARGRTLAPAVTLLWYASEGLRLWTTRADQRR